MKVNHQLYLFHNKIVEIQFRYQLFKILELSFFFLPNFLFFYRKNIDFQCNYVSGHFPFLRGNQYRHKNQQNIAKNFQNNMV